ncbi:beta-lactamase family protein [Archangium gephyra]|uniref:serine hydrolase domain-containing protein n=1 Tax=Archangium gephyra TaxID=48 RepID=UPI0035D43A58
MHFRWYSRALGLLLAFMLMRAAVAAPVPSFETEMDQRVPGLLAKYHVPGAAMALIRDGEVVWSRGYGIADLSTGEPVTAEHIFAHGSNCKPVTAWGALRLVDEGKVELDAPVDRYLKRWHLPASGFNASKVTLRRLLSHTAGLGSDTLILHPWRWQPTLEQFISGQVPFHPPLHVQWEPGTKQQYSNESFAVVQLLIEDVTGEPFEAYMQRTVLQPLGMQRSSFVWTPENKARAVRPHGFRNEPLPYYNVIVQGAGSLVGPVSDFARFLAASMPGPGGLPSGRGVLRPETVALSMSPQPTTDGQGGLDYGLASLPDGRKLIQHAGGYAGWFARFAAVPETRMGLVVVVNSPQGEEFYLAIERAWLRTELGVVLSGPAEPPAPPLVDPIRQGLLGLAAALMLGAVLMLVRILALVRRGRREWSPSGRRLLFSSPFILAVLVWLGWFYGPLPLPPLLLEDCPRELLALTMALVLWATFGALMTFSHERELQGRRPFAASDGGPEGV